MANPLSQLTLPQTWTADFGRAGIAIWLIVLYLVGTRISPDGVGKLGFVAGGIPVYTTELLIMALFALTYLKRPVPLLIWLMSGSGAGFAGGMVWILFWSSIVYTVLSFHEWRIFAVRDLAIFGYSIIYVLAYFVLDTKEKAVVVLKAFVYSGVITAVLLIIDSSLALHILYLPELRGVAGSGDTIVSVGGGDIGGAVAASLGALVVLAAPVREDRPYLRTLYLGLTGICLIALMIAQTRSAALGAVLAVVIGMTGARLRDILSRLVIIAGIIAGGAIVVAILPGTAAQEMIKSFLAIMHSGSELTEDPNFAFRYLRWVYVVNEWKQSPIFGMGFGAPLVPDIYISDDEVGLNAGLPHNTYLTILARMGLFGLLLITIPWIRGIVFCFRPRRVLPTGTAATDDYQRIASTILVFFMGFAGFVLFFERPWHSAPFWITLAAAYRLAEDRRSESAVAQSRAMPGI